MTTLVPGLETETAATAANPDSIVKLHTAGKLHGSWDSGRLSQLLANLLGNAVQHGTPRTMISVTARGEAAEVVLQVHNRGPAIASDELKGS